MSTAETVHSEPNQVPLAPDPRPPVAQVQINDAGVRSLYANFCRVTGTPEEIMIDFGLNMQPFETPTGPLAVTQRIVTNYYTAKRMLHALETVVERYEAAFGVLEVNVQRRVRPEAQ